MTLVYSKRLETWLVRFENDRRFISEFCAINSVGRSRVAVMFASFKMSIARIATRTYVLSRWCCVYLVPVEEDFPQHFEDGVKECSWSSFLLREHYLFCILVSLGWFTKRVECTRVL